MKNKSNIIGTTIILGIIIFMFSLVIICGFCKFLCKHNINNNIINFFAPKKDKTIKIIDVEWEKLYPFKDKHKTSKVSSNNIIDKLNSLKDTIAFVSSEDIVGYNKIVEISYIYDKLLNYSLVSNSNKDSKIKIDDSWCSLSIFDVESLDKYSKNIKKLNEYILNNNKKFIYIQAPDKIEKNNNYVSKIYYDNANKNIDYFLDSIKDDIDILDIRDYIKVTGKDYLNLFFKTDHHWKPETGLLSLNLIINKLNNEYGFNISKDIADINNYNIKVYDNVYLGSEGRKVTLANASPEDISMITPNFETNLKVSMPDVIPYKQGTFEETLMDYNQLECSNIYNSAQYVIYGYGYGNRPLIEIHNENINDGNKILFIRDSYAHVIAPFLSLGVEDCAIIDLRTFKGSLKTYIENYDPDMVILMYYPGMFKESNYLGWDFE